MFTADSVLMLPAAWNCRPPSVLRKMPPSLASQTVPAVGVYDPSRNVAVKSPDRKMPCRSTCAC